jgi:phage-related minor tail protein
MSGKNEVKLTFAGDADKLTKETQRVGMATDEMADRVGKASRKMSEDTGKSSKDSEESIGKIGKAAQGLGAVMVGAGAAAVAAFSSSLEFDSARAKLDAQMGNTKWAGELGKVAGDLYGEGFGEGIGEMNAAVRSVVDSGALMEDATTDQIKNITAQVMSLSEAFDQDLGETMRAVGKAVKTGLVADAQEGLDVITRGLQANVDEAGDLMETFSEYSTQFREIGANGAQAMGLLVQGLRGGARDADVVADSIKEFTVRMKDGTTTAADGFKLLGANGAEMMAKFSQGGPAANEVFTTLVEKMNAIEDPLKRDQAALALFGTKAEDMGDALFSLDPSLAATQLGELSGATQRVNDTMGDTVENRIKIAKREFQEFGASVAGVDGPLGSLAVGVMAFGTDILATAGSLGMVVMTLQQFGLFAKIATAAQWLWNAALSANPIGLIIIAIAALVAGFIWLWNNVDGFREFWVAVWNGIVDVALWVKDRIMDAVGFIVGLFNSLGEGVSAALGWAGDRISEFGQAAGAVGQWIIDRFNDVVGFFKSIPDKIGQAISGLGSIISSGFKYALNLGIDAINWFVDKANSLIAGINKVPGVSLPSIPKLGRMHSGGVVPGFAGQEKLAILEAGETVVPASKSPALGGMSGGGGVVVRFGSDGSEYGDALLAVVKDAVRRAGGNPALLEA